MMLKRHKWISLVVGSVTLSLQANAQLNTPEQHYRVDKNLAEQLYFHHLNRSAKVIAENIPQSNNFYQPLIVQSRVDYIRAQAGAQSKDIKVLEELLNQYNHSSDKAIQQRLALTLARYYFSINDYASAMYYYAMCNIENLSNEEIADAKFEQAYASFLNKDFDKAYNLFGTIRETPGHYMNAGNYYYGILAYNRGEYNNALKSFNKIKDVKEYNIVVPYYIAEIYYYQNERQKALDQTLHLISNYPDHYFFKELNLLAAQIYYDNQQYEQALPYFEYYYNNVEQIRKDVLYEIGNAYFKTNQNKSSKEALQYLVSSNDSIGQSAMYILGQINLQDGNKRDAKNAFGTASDMNYHTKIQEEALILTGKLAYDLSDFNEADLRINKLLQYYPNSRHTNEAKLLLADVYASSGNYAAAFQLLKESSIIQTQYASIAQKIKLGYALDLLRKDQAELAHSLLNEVASSGTPSEYTVAANFWLGELAYQKGQYDESIQQLKQFIAANTYHTRVAQLTPNANISNAHTTLGFAYLKKEDYANAQSQFGSARTAEGELTTTNKVLATMREADAAFLQKDYKKAQLLYETVISYNTVEKDYAILQKAILQGLNGQPNEKIKTLKALIANKESAQYSAAVLELGNQYIEDSQYSEAISTLNLLTTTENVHRPKALMRIGFSQDQIQKRKDAITTYESIVKQYPNFEEKAAVLDALRELYLEDNNPEGLQNFLKDNGYGDVAAMSADSTYYQAAMTQFSNQNFKNAILSFDKYINQFPNGLFVTKATYYRAESHLALKNAKEALDDYLRVLESPFNELSTKSAKEAANLALSLKDYDKASTALNKLMAFDNGTNRDWAIMQLMYLNGHKKDYDTALTYANQLSNTDESISQYIHFLNGQIALQKEDWNEAINHFQSIDKLNDAQLLAESRYLKAYALYKKGAYIDAEKAAAIVLEKSSTEDNWVVKTYLLIGRILAGQKDFFNAKATVQSIVNNTKNADIKNEAKQVLEEIKNLENNDKKVVE